METTAESLSIEIDPPYLSKDSDEVLEKLFVIISKEEHLDNSLLIIDIKPQPPKAFSIVLICKNLSSFNIKKNFEEFLEKRLLPGSDVLTHSSRITHFKLPKVSAETFIFCQIDSMTSSISDFSDVIQNFHERIKEPFKLILQFPDSLDIVIESSFGARSKKTLPIQHNLNKILKRFLSLQKPITMDFLRHSLSCIDNDFLTLRDSRYVAQILLRLHLIEQKLEKEAFRNNTIRHSYLHVKRTILKYQFSSKKVLGIFFGVTFFQEKEVLEQSLLENIITQTFPSLSIVSGSFFSPSTHNKKYKSVYFELEKLDEKKNHHEEIQKLRNHLPQEIKARIPVLIPSIKISTNEEQVMKTILHLSNESETLEDLPQVSISYDHHNENQMIFRVILVNIEKGSHPNRLREILQKEITMIQIHWEKEQVIRFMDEENIKKAYVFQAILTGTTMFNKNTSSGFLYFVRQQVVAFLEEKIGKFRDYNGGMIEKQQERYNSFIQSFQGMSHDYTQLIDHFFFAINPIEAQVTSSFQELRILFSLLLTIYETPVEEYPLYKLSSKDNTFFLVLKMKTSSYSKNLIEKLNFPKRDRIFSLFTKEQVTYLALLSKEEHQSTPHIESLIKSLQEEINQQQILRLSFEGQILSFDPRFAGDYITAVYGKMLFEGLMRLDHTDTPQLAIAQSYEISNQNKRYIFHLRKSYWSNGEPVTAQDFEYAWKSILTPSFQTPFDYLFDPILNAKSAKRGKASKDEIGIKALNESTLIVDLEHPSPSFLSLLCYPIFSPIHQQTDQMHPSWSSEEGKRFVCNGPFSLKSRSSNEFNIIKNTTYWDHPAVLLQSIKIIKADAHLALDLFQANQIDWLGRPIDPWQPFFDHVFTDHEYYPNSLYWFVLNTRKFPFSNQSIRRAFALAIDQVTILKDLVYSGEPASTPLPKQHTLHGNSTALAYNPEKAVQLFEEELRKLDISRQSFPTIPLACANNAVRRQIAEHIKQSLVNVLGIDIVIETYDWPIFFKRMCEGEFFMGGINWSTWIDDPSYTLQSFTEGERKTNFSKWENPTFTALVNKGISETDHQKRLEYWSQAERLLIEHVPVIPMFYEFYRYAKSPYLQNTLIFPSQGIIDFKYSKIVNAKLKCRKFVQN